MSITETTAIIETIAEFNKFKIAIVRSVRKRIQVRKVRIGAKVRRSEE